MELVYDWPHLVAAIATLLLIVGVGFAVWKWPSTEERKRRKALREKQNWRRAGF